jgi:DNA-binding NarL/FixJ family response regulator
MVGVIAFPDSHGGVRDALASRVILLGEVLFHREALARALAAHDDVTLIGSVADVHAALILAEERGPDVLLVDSPSHAIAQVLAAHPLECQIVVIGAGEGCDALGSRADAIVVGASVSLDELHVTLRFGKARHVPPRPPPVPLTGFGGDADSMLTMREREVSRLVADGCCNKEVAAACNISVATVKNHVHRILTKLNVQRRSQIADLARDLPRPIPSGRASNVTDAMVDDDVARRTARPPQPRNGT